VRSSGESLLNPEPYAVRGVSRFSRKHTTLSDLRASSESWLLQDERVVKIVSNITYLLLSIIPNSYIIFHETLPKGLSNDNPLPSLLNQPSFG